jgi:hypothetical protein
MGDSDFDKKKNLAKLKAEASEKTAQGAKPEDKKKALNAAAQDWIDLAKLWKGKNNVFYAEYLQMATADYRGSGEDNKAGSNEFEAANALLEAAEACKATDPVAAQALFNRAAAKYNTAANDFGKVPNPAGKKNAEAKKADAEKESKALDSLVTK